MSTIPDSTPTTPGLTSGLANSSPTATPIDVPGWGPSELDNEVNAFAKQYQADLDAEADAEPIVETAGATTEAAPATTDTSVVTDPALPALTQDAYIQREVALNLREQKVQTWEQERTQMSQRLQELERRQAPDDLITAMRLQPTNTLKQLGLDPDMVIKMALAEKLRAQGAPVPVELTQNIEHANTQMQIRALENKIIAQNREQAQRAYVDSVQQGLKSYVAQDIAKDAPTLAEVAKHAPDKVHEEIMAVIVSDAQARQHRDPNGSIMDYATAAKKVEAKFAEMRRVLGTQSTVTTPAAGTPGTSAPKQVVGQKQVPAVIKPPERPLAPWQQKADLQDAGLAEAMAEYRRIESQK